MKTESLVDRKAKSLVIPNHSDCLLIYLLHHSAASREQCTQRMYNFSNCWLYVMPIT